MKQRITSLLLCFAMVLSLCTFLSFGSAAAEAEEIPTAPEGKEIWDGTVADSYEGGDGTAENPYQISNGAQLALLAEKVNAGEGAEACYVLTQDIYLNDTADYANWKDTTTGLNSWMGIGSLLNDTTFKGVFDGANYTIYGMYAVIKYGQGATHTVDTDRHFGLFVSLQDSAVVRNLSIDKAYLIHHVTLKTTGTTGGLGAIAGSASGTTLIENCHVYDAKIDGRSDPFYTKDNRANKAVNRVVGGIVGLLSATATVRDCTNYNASIYSQNSSGSSSYGSSYRAYSGGIVGKVAGTSKDERANVENCVNYGMVSSKATNGNHGQHPVGGIVGISNCANIKNCVNMPEATLLSVIPERSYVGGVVGIAEVTWIYDCVNYATFGYATADDTTTFANYVGGIVGYFDASSTGGTVSRCVNKGNIFGASYAGGAAGEMSANRTTLSINSFTNYGNIVCTKAAGGVVGYMSSTQYNTAQHSQVYYSVNYGTVTSTGKDTNSVAGGIAGRGTLLMIAGCVNYGNVNAVIGASGIISICTNASSVVANCVNAGAVTVTHNGENASTAAGIAAAEKGAFENCVNVGSVTLAGEASEVECFISETLVALTSSAKDANLYYVDGDCTAADGIVATNAMLGTAVSADDLANGTLVATLNAYSQNHKTASKKATWYQGKTLPLTITAYLTEATYAGASVTLADAFSVSVLVKVDGALTLENTTVTVKKAVGGIVTDIELVYEGDVEYEGVTYKKYTLYDIIASAMAENSSYVIVVKNGNYTAWAQDLAYNIYTYAVNQYKKTADESLKALIESMMYYGAAANSADILDAFATETGYVVSETYVTDAYASLDLQKILNQGDDLTLVDKALVALSLANTIRPVFQIDGAAYIIVEFNGKNDYRYESENTYFVIDCLFATALEDGFRVKAYDENNECIGQMKYSVATYVLDLLGDESDATDAQKTLAMATAVYMNQAKAYKISH